MATKSPSASAPIPSSTAALPPSSYRPTHPLVPHPDAIREAARLLRHADRPLLLAGGGVNWAGASDLVVRLSEEYSIPMITAYGRNDAVPNAHPLYVGPLGRAGAPEAARLAANPTARLTSSMGMPSQPASVIIPSPYQKW